MGNYTCSKCGHPISATTVHCPTCGVRFTKTVTVELQRPPTRYASASLSIGLSSLSVPICGPVALVLGLLGLARDKDARGTALAGIILGGIATLFLLVIITLAALRVIDPP